MPDPPTTAIPGYRDVVPVGHGGLGDVYRARRTSDGAVVAIKLLRDVSDTSQAWHRARRELAALTALGGHPNVVQPIALIELNRRPGLVMEYAPGGSVADLIDSGTQLTLDEVVFVGRQAATALAAAHRRKIVHRDVKPHNLLIDGRGQVKLCDFGIAAVVADDDYGTRTNVVSTRYASPEELDHDAAGPASDVYSLGATLLHLWRDTSLTLKDRLAAWTPPAESDPRGAAVDHLIAGCLQPCPGDRPTAAVVLDVLDGLALSDGVRRVSALRVEPRPTAVPADAAATVVLADPAGAAARSRPHPLSGQEVTLARRPVVSRPIATPVIVGRRRLHTRGVVVVTACVLCVAALAVWSAKRGSTEPAVESASTTAPADRPATVARPAGLVSLVDVDWGRGPVGECLLQQPDRPSLQSVDCALAHDLQRFAEGELSASSLADGSPADGLVTAACDAAFSGFVGSTSATTSLDVAVRRPTAASWASGDRGYACYVGVDGARVVGDARTTGW